MDMSANVTADTSGAAAVLKLAVLSSVANICLSHYKFEKLGLVVFFFNTRYQIGNYSMLKMCFGPVVLCSHS